MYFQTISSIQCNAPIQKCNVILITSRLCNTPPSLVHPFQLVCGSASPLSIKLIGTDFPVFNKWKCLVPQLWKPVANLFLLSSSASTYPPNKDFFRKWASPFWPISEGQSQGLEFTAVNQYMTYSPIPALVQCLSSASPGGEIDTYEYHECAEVKGWGRSGVSC